MKRYLVAAMLLVSVAAQAKPTRQPIAIRGRRIGSVTKALSANGYKHDPSATIGVLFVHSDTPAARKQVAEAYGRGQRLIVVVPSAQTLSPQAHSDYAVAGAEHIVVDGADFHDKAMESIVDRLASWHEIESQVAAAKAFPTASLASLRTLREVAEAARSDAPILIVGESGTGRYRTAQWVAALRGETHWIAKGERERLDYRLAEATIQRDAHTGGSLLIRNMGRISRASELGEALLEKQVPYEGVAPFNALKISNPKVIATHTSDRVDEPSRQELDPALKKALTGGTIIRLPALRERKEDIPLLAKIFIEELRPTDPPAISPEVEAQLMARDYPDNVRDLKRLVERIVNRHKGTGPLTINDVPRGDLVDLSAKPE